MPCCGSQRNSSGTSSIAGGEFGFEKMPTVLTTELRTAIEQELLVAFRAGDGAFHNLRFETQLFGGCLDLCAGRLVQRRIAHDAAFSDLPFTCFKLRLYQDDKSAR